MMKIGRIFSTESLSVNQDAFATTALRVFVGLSMGLTHGMGKTPPPQQLVDGLTGMGFPMPEVFAWLAALSELLGGIFLALGLATRPAAFFMTFTMGVAAFVAHSSDPFNVKEMALLYFFVGLFFVFRGAGKWSLDSFLSKKLNS